MMVSKIIGFIALLFIFPHAEKNDRLNQINKFLNGNWVIEETADSRLQSMHFFGGDCINFTFRDNPHAQSILKKYEYVNVDDYPQHISLNVYTKDIVSDKKLTESPFHIEIMDKNTIRVTSKLGEINTLKRKPRNARDIHIR
ncbi:hypothetical protein [Sphingobacterium chuzhouense]|uniref:Lipocalin-like domain-containing protein n=1 Tax=Sphingobacterium chuzhouense TaxID=1742264 RepID=A0ABR7XVR3_9SPHI|nr:hypothetical protein [Sphingobacterium chuzhouense]MBD1423147.1 hypothetical protein [Sphingobacterium chuzhouense]